MQIDYIVKDGDKEILVETHPEESPSSKYRNLRRYADLSEEEKEKRRAASLNKEGKVSKCFDFSEEQFAEWEKGIREIQEYTGELRNYKENIVINFRSFLIAAINEKIERDLTRIRTEKEKQKEEEK